MSMLRSAASLARSSSRSRRRWLRRLREAAGPTQTYLAEQAGLYKHIAKLELRSMRSEAVIPAVQTQIRSPRLHHRPGAEAAPVVNVRGTRTVENETIREPAVTKRLLRERIIRHAFDE